MEHFMLEIVKDGQIKVLYHGGCDGQPYSAGVAFLEALRTYNIADFAKNIAMFRFISRNEIQKTYETVAEINRCDVNTLLFLSKLLETYPHLSEFAGANILHVLMQASEPLGMADDFDEIRNCHFAYFIDLDKNTFSAYSDNERFGVYPLSNLPSDDAFLADYYKWDKEFAKRFYEGFYFAKLW